MMGGECEVIIIPQAWVVEYRPLPDGWLEQHARGLLRVCPEFPRYLTAAAKAGHCDERLVVTRVETEQGLGYAYDGSTSHYGGGAAGDAAKLKYLCGVDKTDNGPREGGWFGPERQALGCTLRFGYWYRGKDGPRPEWRNWLGLREDPRYRTGVPVTRGGVTITPANQASADALRYTTSMPAQERLRAIGLRWFPEDYEEESAVNFDLTRPIPGELEVTEEQAVSHILGYPVARRIDFIGVHHSSIPSEADYYRAGALASVRSIRSHHMNKRGWRDAGYHFEIGPDGRIFLARPMSQSGAHILNQNAHSIGVCLIGNYSQTNPTTVPGYAVLQRICAALIRRYALLPGDVYPHRAKQSTDCPGAKFDFDEFRRGVNEAALPGGGEIPDEVLKIVVGTGAVPEAVIDEANARVEDGTMRADVRPLLEALGYRVHGQHLATQGKVYIEEA